MKWVGLPDEEDFLMRPVLAGMCSYENVFIHAGVLDLVDIARMNDALDAQMENERRYRKAQED